MARLRLGFALALLPALVVALVATTGCADEPRIWFENHRDEAVTISIDGDRLIRLRPHHTEYLPYSTAAWAWPRRIDVATRAGVPISSEYLDADDLARQRWTIYIRP